MYTQSEQLVAKLSQRSFLSLWTYPNPKSKGNKELCDVLVVCDPHVIIFSVKEISVTNSGNIKIDWERWRRRAIAESVDQINGAVRWLETAKNVITHDGKAGLPFPDLSRRQVHRIAVAFGSQGKVPFQMGDFGKGFVHIFDELSLDRVMGELDTITDFIGYLRDKEDFLNSGKEITITGGEEDLLALYLHNGRLFPTAHDHIVVGNDSWDGFTGREEYKNKQAANANSYIWDRLIEIFHNDFATRGLEFGNSLEEVDAITRIMTREDRFSRRVLGKAFNEFMELTSESKKNVRSRMTVSPSGILYVFLACKRGTERKNRIAELHARCFVARGLNPECKTVIGLATERYEEKAGFSLDALCLKKPYWTEEDQAKLVYLQNELGFFKAPVQSTGSEDEYPLS
jgi:hypothetical protein